MERAAAKLVEDLWETHGFNLTLPEARVLIDRMADAGVIILSESGRRS
jgi:hypothetical protein